MQMRHIYNDVSLIPGQAGTLAQIRDSQGLRQVACEAADILPDGRPFLPFEPQIVGGGVTGPLISGGKCGNVGTREVKPLRRLRNPPLRGSHTAAGGGGASGNGGGGRLRLQPVQKGRQSLQTGGQLRPRSNTLACKIAFQEGRLDPIGPLLPILPLKPAFGLSLR